MWFILPSLLFTLLLIWCLWRIVEKLGLPGILAILFFVPVVNVVFLAYLAFAELPSARPPVVNAPPPELPPPDDTSAPSTCAACGAAIPAGVAACPACGWTYRAPAEPPTAPPLEPPSTEKTFRDFRGF